MTTTAADDLRDADADAVADADAAGDGAAGDAEPTTLTALSPSRAADFMACPLLYKFRAVDRLPERPSPAAARGTLVHAVLEQLFDLPAVERTPGRARDLLPALWQAMVEADPGLIGCLGDAPDAVDQWFATCVGLLDGYFALEDPRRLEPAAREHYVEVPLEGGPVLRGYVDRLDRAPTGEVRIVDYKTGRAPGEAFEGKALFQMKFYALVLWRTTGVVPRELRLIYLGDRDMLRYCPNADELTAFERTVRALWQAIQRAHATGDWRPNPGRLCEWCEHRGVHCPQFPADPDKTADYERWRATRAPALTARESSREQPATATLDP